MSFLERHRTVCAVIQEIREKAIAHGDDEIVKLCDEAFGYTRRMSAKLTEYKYREITNAIIQDSR